MKVKLKKRVPLQESINKIKRIFVEVNAFTADGRSNNYLHGTYVGGKEYNPYAKYDASDTSQSRWDRAAAMDREENAHLARSEVKEYQKINQMLAKEIFNPLAALFNEILRLEKNGAPPNFTNEFTRIWNLRQDLIDEEKKLFVALKRNSPVFYIDTHERKAEIAQTQARVVAFQQKMKILLDEELHKFLDLVEKTFGTNQTLERLVDELAKAIGPVAKYLMSVLPKVTQPAQKPTQQQQQQIPENKITHSYLKQIIVEEIKKITNK